MIDFKEQLNRLRPTLIFLLPLILVVALALVLRMREQSRPVAFTIDMPQTITIVPTESVAQVELTLNLQNRAASDIDLVANNDCEVFQWFLLDNAGSFVQGQMLNGCGDYPVADVLRGRGTLVRTTTIPLYTGRLDPGQRYQLAVRFWGYETMKRFRIRAEEAD